jgi:hypothetical protein
MGYRVVADRYQLDQMRQKYGPRQGLEGPFHFSGRVLYYDVKAGQYYDPTCDWYVSNEEMTAIHEGLLAKIKG